LTETHILLSKNNQLQISNILYITNSQLD